MGCSLKNKQNNSYAFEPTTKIQNTGFDYEFTKKSDLKAQEKEEKKPIEIIYSNNPENQEVSNEKSDKKTDNHVIFF